MVLYALEAKVEWLWGLKLLRVAEEEENEEEEEDDEIMYSFWGLWLRPCGLCGDDDSAFSFSFPPLPDAPTCMNESSVALVAPIEASIPKTTNPKQKKTKK